MSKFRALVKNIGIFTISTVAIKLVVFFTSTTLYVLFDASRIWLDRYVKRHGMVGFPNCNAFYS